MAQDRGPEEFYREHRDSLTAFATALAARAADGERAVRSAIAQSYEHYLRHRTLSPDGCEPLQWLVTLIARQVAGGAFVRRSVRDHAIAVLRWGHGMGLTAIGEILDIPLGKVQASVNRTIRRFGRARRAAVGPPRENNSECLNPAESAAQ